MAIDVSALNLCPEQIGDIYETYFANETWFTKVNAITGIEGKEVRTVHLDVDATLRACCESGDDTATFGEVVLPIACIKSEQKFCNEELLGIIKPSGIRVTAGMEDYGIVGQRLANAYLKKFILNLSDFAWNGGTIGGTVYEGYLDLAGIDYTATSTNIFSLIREAYLALPIDARTNGGTIGIFVGQDVLPFYQMYLLDKNLFNFTPEQYTPDKEYPMLGFGNVRIIGVAALNGTGKMLVTPMENIYWATNRIDDKDTYAWLRCECDDTWINRIKTLFGMGFYRPEFAVAVTFDADILSNPYALPVDIVSPRGTLGGVLTEAAV